QYFELRTGKESAQQASSQVLDPNYFPNMLVYNGLAEGCVSGAAHSTADTVRAALKLIITKAGMNRVSGQVIMEKGDQRD
ncbi:phosphate acyltransferase, partial [Lactobacillus jensenii]|uniref:phosphate acyltransferase n=1 Tax=Lactobacillus jensenii TaxID=109790 RepID=UPI0028705ED2